MSALESDQTESINSIKQTQCFYTANKVLLLSKNDLVESYEAKYHMLYQRKINSAFDKHF